LESPNILQSNYPEHLKKSKIIANEALEWEDDLQSNYQIFKENEDLKAEGVNLQSSKS
jgi:hypothetical protein